MRSIWMLNHSSHTPTTGKWTRHYHLGRHLAQLGWKVRVITASVDRHGVEQPLRPGENYRHEVQDGVDFTYLRTPEYRGHGGGRIRNMVTFLWRAIGRGPHRGIEKPDVVVGCTVHPLAALAGWFLARRYGVPFFFEVRDLWPESLIQFGLISRGSLPARGLGALEKFLYRRADRIISTLPNIGRYLEKHGLPADKVRWITNGIDFAALPPYEEPPARDGFRITYIGSLAHSYGLETLIEAMKLIHDAGDPGIELELVGDGELREYLEEEVRRHGLDIVRFAGAVPRAEVPAVAARADAFVIMVRDLPELYCYGISMNKLTEYLAIGRPIVISVGPEVNNMVAEADTGLTVLPERPEELAAAIRELAALPRGERLAMGRRGREFARENLDYAQLARRYRNVLDELFR